jgi:hypothetical protein
MALLDLSELTKLHEDLSDYVDTPCHFRVNQETKTTMSFGFSIEDGKVWEYDPYTEFRVVTDSKGNPRMSVGTSGSFDPNDLLAKLRYKTIANFIENWSDVIVILKKYAPKMFEPYKIEKDV